MLGVARGGVRAIRSSRARRQKAGRWYAGKRLQRPRPRAGPSNRLVSTTPAAYNVGVSRSPSNDVFSKVERVAWDLTSNHSKDFANYKISPLNVSLFPGLSTLACSYSQYQFVSLSFKWVPRVSTNVGSTVAIGWMPQVTNEPNDYQSREKLTSMPVFVQTAARQGVTLNIPRQFLAKKRLSPETDNYDDNNYNTGHVFFYGYGEEATDIGDIMVSYTCKCFERKLSDTTVATSLNLLEGTCAEPMSLLGLQVYTGEGGGPNVWTCTSARNLKIVYHNTYSVSGASTIEVDAGSGFTPVADSFSMTSGTHSLSFYDFAIRSGDLIRFNQDAGCVLSRALVMKCSLRVVNHFASD